MASSSSHSSMPLPLPRLPTPSPKLGSAVPIGGYSTICSVYTLPFFSLAHSISLRRMREREREDEMWGLQIMAVHPLEVFKLLISIKRLNYILAHSTHASNGYISYQLSFLKWCDPFHWQQTTSGRLTCQEVVTAALN